MKIYPGIIELRHLIDLRRTVLLKERCAERRKEHLQYRCNQVWMKNGGQIPWNATPHMRDVLGNHLTDQSFHLVSGLDEIAE